MGPIIIIAVLALLAWLAFTAMLPTTLTWALTIIFGALSLLLIVGNPVAGVMARRRGKNYSFAPFLGGILGVLSLLFCPIHGVCCFAWVPLILDLSFPMFLYAVFVLGIFWADPNTKSDTRACPRCGRQNSIHTRVCPRCSTKLDASGEP